MASIFLISWCLWVVVVAVIVDWDGLPFVVIFIASFMNDFTYVRYVEVSI
jgi:hypothetical protein